MDRQPERQQQTQGDVEFVNTILKRLQHHYLNGTQLPYKEQPLTLTLLYRLYRHVAAEGYGQ
ncbi:MAG: hypothetical protein KatS3mg057_2320 [Herpetosiphonaceae bacterium]|nr:MAG: hypothetical protein KatS3mg057_2320 [Herpetosiphonaceae bacterium]